MTVVYASTTLIRQKSLYPPSSVCATITVEPGLSAETVPLSTVATLLLIEDHKTFLFVAVSGFTTAVKVKLSPTPTISLSDESVIPVT